MPRVPSSGSEEHLYLPNGRQARIGVLIRPGDPFWVQVGQFVAERLGTSFVELGNHDPEEALSEAEQASMLEGILSEELDACLCTTISSHFLGQILDSGVPVVSLDERAFNHPAYTCLRVLEQTGQLAGRYLATRLPTSARVLCIAGESSHTDHDSSANRVLGLVKSLAARPDIEIQHLRSFWRYEDAAQNLETQFRRLDRPPDGIFGLSDSIALAARDVGRKLGVVTDQTVIVGVNGDPLALAAIAEGSLSATVSTPAKEFAWRAVAYAMQAACKQPLPPHYGFTPQLVTGENVTPEALQKLIEIAGIPSRLVGVNRLAEQNRVKQLEV